MPGTSPNPGSETERLIAAAFAEGIRLFNTGAFFEAHEAWEGAWLRSEGRERMFYHGLIQAAAAFVHLQRNQRKGAQLLYQKSLDKLQHFSGEYLGLQIGQLNSDLATVFTDVLAESPETPIEGPAYLARAPQISWTPPAAQASTEPVVRPAVVKQGFLNDDSARQVSGK